MKPPGPAGRRLSAVPRSGRTFPVDAHRADESSRADPVLSRAAVRQLDRRAIEEYGIPSALLMENAGRACADEADEMGALLPGAEDEPVLVLCGPGNNGGDGLVVARTLENRGRRARVVFVGAPEKLEGAQGDVALMARLWRGLGQEIEFAADASAVRALAPALARAPLVVDALFGTGLTRALGEPWTELIRLLRSAGRPVLAVDVPSGLDADTGLELGAAVRASVTVTFVARKPGFARALGPEACGRVVVAEIGIPRAFVEEALRAERGLRRR